MADVATKQLDKPAADQPEKPPETVFDEIRKMPDGTTAAAISQVRDRFDKIDLDKNGYLEFKELDAEVTDCGTSDENRIKKGMNIIIRDRIDHVQRMSNDEWGTENNGISKADLDAWQKVANPNLMIEDWSMYAGLMLQYRGPHNTNGVEKFVEFVMKLPPERRREAVDRMYAVNRNDRWELDRVSSVHITFGDLNKDGKRDEITDARVHEPIGCQCGRPGCGRKIEKDAYDP